MEKYYIKKFNTTDRKYGYNATYGGQDYYNLTEDALLKMGKTLSKQKNSTGFFRVSKSEKKDAKQGFVWSYQYPQNNGKKGVIRSIDLLELKEKVKNNNLEWIVIKKDIAEKSLAENEYNMRHKKQKSSTGIFRVQKSNYNPPICSWSYVIRKNGKTTKINDKNLINLEKKVLKRGLEWNIVDEKLAKESYRINDDAERYRDQIKKQIDVGNTGFYRVTTVKCDTCASGYVYKYAFYNQNSKIDYIMSTNLNELKEKVKRMDLEWKIINKKLANSTLIKNDEYLKDKSSHGNTGFWNVYKKNCPKCKHGYIYAYFDSQSQKYIHSTRLIDLKKKIENKGLLWKVVDEESSKDILKLESRLQKSDNVPYISEGLRNGKKYYYLRYKSKIIKRSNNKEVLQNLIDSKEYVQLYEDKINGIKRKSTPTITETIKHGKKCYNLNYKSTKIKQSINKEVLQNLIDSKEYVQLYEDKINGIKRKSTPTINKVGFVDDKQNYTLRYEGLVLKSSVDKDFLQNLIDSGQYLVLYENKIRGKKQNIINRKYSLWDETKVQYRKSVFKNNNGLNPLKCFTVKYNFKKIACGTFNDFLSPIIIHDLIDEFKNNN